MRLVPYLTGVAIGVCLAALAAFGYHLLQERNQPALHVWFMNHEQMIGTVDVPPGEGNVTLSIRRQVDRDNLSESPRIGLLPTGDGLEEARELKAFLAPRPETKATYRFTVFVVPDDEVPQLVVTGNFAGGGSTLREPLGKVLGTSGPVDRDWKDGRLHLWRVFVAEGEFVAYYDVVLIQGESDL